VGLYSSAVQVVLYFGMMASIDKVYRVYSGTCVQSFIEPIFCSCARKTQPVTTPSCCYVHQSPSQDSNTLGTCSIIVTTLKRKPWWCAFCEQKVSLM